MPVLEALEIKKIKEKLAVAEVSHESLSIDLVDHICCMIEERLEQGFDLKMAEEDVFKELGAVQLKSIEIETKRLTQNKFIMKKRTKIIGLIALGLIVTGLLFKLLHLPGSGILWGIGILMAAFGFFLILMIDSFSYEKSSSKRINTVIGYLGAATLIVGLGFAYLSWPYSVYLAEGGGVLLLVYFILNNSVSPSNEGSK
jgi:hypothetical protein